VAAIAVTDECDLGTISGPVRVFIAKKKFLVTTDVEGFRQAANELVERFAKELKRRYAEDRKGK